MTTYTKAQLRNRVLQELGVLSGGGEVATAEDAEMVETVIDDIHSMLDREIFVTWVTSSIPSSVMEPLVLVIAQRLAARFGLPDTRRAELAQAAIGAMGELRTQVQAEANDAPVRAVFY